MIDYKIRLPFILCIAIIMAGCSSDERPPLKGERISVLQHQNNLNETNTNQSAQEIILTEAKSNTAWPQMLGNASHTPQHLAFGSGFKQVWKSSIGDGSSRRSKLITPPIVAFNRVFTSDTQGFVSALDLKTGKEIWQTTVVKEEEPTVSSGLAFYGDTLYVTNGLQNIIALDPVSGQKKWSRNLKNALRGSPTVNNNRLYMITLDDQTVALDTTTGDTLWRHQGVSEQAGLLGTPSPAAAESVVISVYNSGDISALRAETGQEAWSDNLTGIAEFQNRAVTTLSGFHGHPILDGDIVVAGNAGGKIVAIHVPSGDRLWQKEFGVVDTPWVTGNMVYVISSQNELVALSKETGVLAWTKPLPRYEDEEDKEDTIFWHGPILAGNRLWLVNNIGQLVAIDPANGKSITTYSVIDDIMLPPIVVDNMMILINDEGTVVAYSS